MTASKAASPNPVKVHFPSAGECQGVEMRVGWGSILIEAEGGGVGEGEPGKGTTFEM